MHTLIPGQESPTVVRSPAKAVLYAFLVYGLALTSQHGVDDTESIAINRLYPGRGTQSRQQDVVVLRPLEKQIDKLATP